MFREIEAQTTTSSKVSLKGRERAHSQSRRMVLTSVRREKYQSR